MFDLPMKFKTPVPVIEQSPIRDFEYLKLRKRTFRYAYGSPAFLSPPQKRGWLLESLSTFCEISAIAGTRLLTIRYSDESGQTSKLLFAVKSASEVVDTVFAYGMTMSSFVSSNQSATTCPLWTRTLEYPAVMSVQCTNFGDAGDNLGGTLFYREYDILD